MELDSKTKAERNTSMEAISATADKLSKQVQELSSSADLKNMDLTELVNALENTAADWYTASKFTYWIAEAFRKHARSKLTNQEILRVIQGVAVYGKNYTHVMEKRGITDTKFMAIMTKHEFTQTTPKNAKEFSLPRMGTAWCDLLLIARASLIKAAAASNEHFGILDEARTNHYIKLGLPQAAQSYGMADLLRGPLLSVYLDFLEEITVILRGGAKLDAKQLNKTQKIIRNSIGKWTCVTESESLKIRTILGSAASAKSTNKDAIIALDEPINYEVLVASRDKLGLTHSFDARF